MIMAGIFEFISAVAVVVILTWYYYYAFKYTFWSKQGVKGPKPSFPFGNVKELVFGSESITNLMRNLYTKYKHEPIIGFYNFGTPMVLLKDPDLIKDVLIKNFSNFSDRGQPVAERADPLSQNLVNLEPKKWKPLRIKLSPTFTSGKIKEMYHLMVECSKKLEDYMAKDIPFSKDIECRDLLGKFTMEIIGSCAFGINVNALSNEENEFLLNSKLFFVRGVRKRAAQNFPKLYNLLGYILPYAKQTKFFSKIVADNIEYRKTNNVVRHDFIDLLLELKDCPDKLGLEITDEFLAAQAVVFFLAGYETSALVMSHALYELALHQEIQEKLRDEIKKTIAKCGGKLEIDDIKSMEYLNAVYREILRKYSPISILKRKAAEGYTFNGTKVHIPKGTEIIIPVWALHRDPDIYPEPDVFDPNRFLNKESTIKHPMHYLPFGDGPRNCIGARFAVHQTKLGIITVIKNFKVDVCEKTISTYEVDSKSLFLAPKQGLHVKLINLNSQQ
ncbi:cytochrome P450 6B7-like [Prorops nasuta]|uniref:cytochrome P450 6B7-like n=1 Tax=Prorops nasuta TaxID=863751 RepID=UPI0034CE1F12